MIVLKCRGGYLLAGQQYTFSGYRWGLLIRADSAGNFLWRRTYSEKSIVTSLQLQANGRVLLGAQMRYPVPHNPAPYFKSLPRFMLVDSANGNIIKDTVYTKGFAGQHSQGVGNIFKDVNGGYFHWGQIDTLTLGDPVDAATNFWDYLMHLDENFRQHWIKVFPVIQPDTILVPVGHRYIWLVKQTRDSGYILIGSGYFYIPSTNTTITCGWAAKINKHGNAVWDNTYVVDSNRQAYLTDGIEMPDGGFVFTGSATDTKLPSWHGQDVWLLRVDSNGCAVQGCVPTKIITKQETGNDIEVKIYPNPTTGSFTIQTSLQLPPKEGGLLSIYNMQGQVVATYNITQQKTNITLPSSLNAGVYMGKFISADNKMTVLRIVYQP